MRPLKEVGPDATNAEANQTEPHHEARISNSTSPDEFDFDKRVVAQVDRSLWNALFDGHFRLAVKCDVCGRWLTASASKRAHRGPRCSARAGGAS